MYFDSEPCSQLDLLSLRPTRDIILKYRPMFAPPRNNYFQLIDVPPIIDLYDSCYLPQIAVGIAI